MKAKTKVETKTQLHKYIVEFLEYCEIERNHSPKTIANYAHYLGRFENFAQSQGSNKPEQINLDLVRAYRLYLNRLRGSAGRGLKLISQNYHVIALRAFLRYLSKRDVASLSAEKIELAKNPGRQIEALDIEDIHRILAATAQEKNEILRLRDLAILLALFSSGVRVSELISLKKNGINLKRGEFTVRGKGDKLRLTFLSPQAVTAVQNYLKKRADNHPSLFINHTQIGRSVEKQMQAMSEKDGSKKAGLTARSVQRLIHKYGLLAGVTRKVTPHTFRHSFATDLLQNGADIRSVQSLLGHASITTTQIYTHLTNQGLREVHKKFHNRKQ